MLIGVLALLGEGVKEEEGLKAVRELDEVLVVAGAPGKGRVEIVFELMGRVQRLLVRKEGEEELEPEGKKRRKLATAATRRTIPSPHITTSLPSIDYLPSLSEFETLIKRGPFVIKGGCATWPAIEKWSSMDYLKNVISGGRGRVVPVEIGNDYTEREWGQKILEWETFLEGLEKEAEGEGGKMYLAQHDLFRQFPLLERDVVVPDYVYSDVENLLEEGKYEGPKTEEGESSGDARKRVGLGCGVG